MADRMEPAEYDIHVPSCPARAGGKCNCDAGVRRLRDVFTPEEQQAAARYPQIHRRCQAIIALLARAVEQGHGLRADKKFLCDLIYPWVADCADQTNLDADSLTPEHRTARDEAMKITASTSADPVVHPTGAKRSQLMPHYASIDELFLWRLAQVHTGAPKGEHRLDPRTGFQYHGGDLEYGRGNWRKGLPMVDTFGHLMRHLYDWKEMIDQGEMPANDELGAAAWNIEVLMHFERQYVREAKQRIREGRGDAG